MSQTMYQPRTSYRPRPQYRPAPKPVEPHPIAKIRADAYKTQDKAHPVRSLIQQCLGKHAIIAVVEEDIQTLATLKGVEGLIAFICTLTSADGRVIAQGRGSAILGPNTRFLSRAVAAAYNGAVADAAYRGTRVLDTFRTKSETEIEEAMRDVDSEPATEKQREFIRQLIRVNVLDGRERDDWEQRIPELTKAEASRAIEAFRA